MIFKVKQYVAVKKIKGQAYTKTTLLKTLLVISIKSKI